MRDPWDLLRGLDVFDNKSLLNSELSVSLIRHWAPNCSTFSRARERPIPGVRFSPKPLRNDTYPEGIPEVLAQLPASKKRKLDLDTRMANMAAEGGGLFGECCHRQVLQLGASPEFHSPEIEVLGEAGKGKGSHGNRIPCMHVRRVP